MRQTYHFCVSSHDEVMFRSESDLIRGFNCFALAVLETESRALSDGHMTTHMHGCVQTDYLDELIRRNRYSYTRFFNSKYHRKGPIGEAEPFFTELKGVKRINTALSYTNRQGLHHGISTTPFGYPHCSANAFFRKDLGKDITPELISNSKRFRYIPGEKSLSSEFRMSANGLLLREDIIDVAYVEELYVTPRNFLYQMNRCSNEGWKQEQLEEMADTPPITLDLMENSVADFNLQSCLTNEKGWINNNRMTDLELCEYIDKIYIPAHFRGIESVYQLTDNQRKSMGNDIYKMSPPIAPGQFSLNDRTFTLSQLKRCAVILK